MIYWIRHYITAMMLKKLAQIKTNETQTHNVYTLEQSILRR